MRFNYSQHSHSMATLKTQTLDIMKKVLFAIILLSLTAMGYAQTQQQGYVKTKGRMVNGQHVRGFTAILMFTAKSASGYGTLLRR